MQDTEELVFVVATATEEPTDTMLIDIRPATDLTPIRDLPASLRPALVYLAGLSRGSKRTQEYALREACRLLDPSGCCTYADLPWHVLRFQHVDALRATLIEEHDHVTANKILSAVRAVLKRAWQLGHMDADTYMRAVDVKRIEGSDGDDQAAGRALSHGEQTQLLRVCAADASPAGPRDAAILGLGFVAGLRRAEIAGLALADYTGTAVTIRKGKRNKSRTVPIATGLAAALADWLTVRGVEPGPLFLTIDKTGQLGRRGLAPAAIARIAHKRRLAAGLEHFSPHDLRRTFAGDLLDAGADIATVQKLMGHADPRTTAGYDRRGERAKVAAVGKLHMSWTRRTA